MTISYAHYCHDVTFLKEHYEWFFKGPTVSVVLPLDAKRHRPSLGSTCIFQNTEPLQRSDVVPYMYYRSLNTLKAPADLIKFLGCLTSEMPENAESSSRNDWCREPI